MALPLMYARPDNRMRCSAPTSVCQYGFPLPDTTTLGYACGCRRILGFPLILENTDRLDIVNPVLSR